jgi:hypothetical protein
MVLREDGHFMVNARLQRALMKRHGSRWQVFLFPLQGGETSLFVPRVFGVLHRRFLKGSLGIGNRAHGVPRNQNI